MFLIEDRLSDSPLVERVWQARSESAETFLSVAASHFQMVVTRHKGRTFLTLRGPETKATSADGPAGGDWLGVAFHLGTLVPTLLPETMLARSDPTLPTASTHPLSLNRPSL